MASKVFNWVLAAMLIGGFIISVWALSHDPTRPSAARDAGAGDTPSPTPMVGQRPQDPDVADEFDQERLDRHGVDRREVREVVQVLRDNGGYVGPDHSYRAEASEAASAVNTCVRVHAGEQEWHYYRRGLIEYLGHTPEEATTIVTYLREDFCPSLKLADEGATRAF